MVHLKPRLASAIAVFFILALLSGCNANREEKKALAEANALSSGYYKISIVGQNEQILFAYQTEVLHIGDMTQWDGLASVGAYNMAFQQECHSVYSEEVQAKLWRNKWVAASATTPSDQLSIWLQSCADGKGIYNDDSVPLFTVLPVDKTDERRVISVQLEKARMSWNAICDANIDSYFGSQQFLTDLTTATVTLYFDVDTRLLAGAKFAGKTEVSELSGTIIVSTAEGHALSEFPNPDSISEGVLAEEWEIVRS